MDHLPSPVGLKAAATLRHLADLIDDGGLPAPIGITISTVTGGMVIQPEDADELAAWCTALDVVEPVWEAYTDTGETLLARWPAGTFDETAVELACVSTAHQPAVAS